MYFGVPGSRPRAEEGARAFHSARVTMCGHPARFGFEPEGAEVELCWQGLMST